MLQDLQIAVNWAKERMDTAAGGKITYPEKFQHEKETYEKIKDIFDFAVHNFIVKATYIPLI